MTNDLTKMGNEELLDEYVNQEKIPEYAYTEKESRDADKKAEELRAELLQRLAPVPIPSQNQIAMSAKVFYKLHWPTFDYDSIRADHICEFAEAYAKHLADSDGWVSPQEREPELTEMYAGQVRCRRVYFIRLGFPLTVIEGRAIVARNGQGVIFYSDRNPACVYYSHDVTFWKPRPLPQPPKKG